METLALLLWALSGAYLGYKADLIFNYAMHMRYTLTVPKVKSPFTEGSFYLFLLFYVVCGPLSILLTLVTAQYIPKGCTYKDGFTAVPGTSYRNESRAQTIERYRKYGLDD